MSLLKSSGGSATGLLGKQTAPKDLGYDAKLILVPEDAEIATKTLALTESTWLDAINSAVGTRYIVLPINYDIESNPEESVYATSSLGSKEFIREGKDTVRYMFIVSPFVMAQMRTLNGVDWKTYIATSSGVIKGTSIAPANGAFKPFSIGNFRVEKEIKPTGSEPAMVVIEITYDDPSEWTSHPAFVEPLREGEGGNWNPRDLRDPKAITSLVTNGALTGFDIYLEGYDQVPFEGAVEEDVIIKDTTTGVVTAVTTLTESATIPGQYAALATIAAGTYYIGMAPVGTSGATQGYAGLVSDYNTVVIS